MNKESKEKYKSDFILLSKYLNLFDPCGLIQNDPPENEYDSITQKLLSHIYNKKSRQEIKELIIHEVVHYFGTNIGEKYENEFHSEIDKFINGLEESFAIENKKSYT